MAEDESKFEKGVDRDTVINAGIQLIPYVGGSIATLYFGRKQERRFKRLETFYFELKSELNGFQNRLADINDQNPEEFRAILEELHEQIESEQISSKKKYYKTYFKSTLVEPVNGNYDERKLFLNILKSLSNIQIEILTFLVQHGKPVISNQIQKPGVDKALVKGAVGQLVNHGLLNSQLNSIAFGGGGGQMDESISVSKFGTQFHDFCVNGKL
jgi:hypothetical protein